jgi:hypothetical protein
LTDLEMIRALELAAKELSSIHYYACHDMDTELQNLMSAIDSCIVEAVDLLESRR